MRRRLSLLVKIEGDPLKEEEAEEVVIQWSLLANIEGDPLNRRRRRAYYSPRPPSRQFR